MDAQASSSSTAGDNVKQRPQSIAERTARLGEEKKATSDDIRDVYAEAKGDGFEVKALRRIVRLRRMDASQKAANDEVETILETYMQALGML